MTSSIGFCGCADIDKVQQEVEYPVLQHLSAVATMAIKGVDHNHSVQAQLSAV